VIERDGRDHPNGPTEPSAVVPPQPGSQRILIQHDDSDVRPLKHDNGVVGAMAIGHILVRIPVVFLTLTIDKVAKMIFLARFGSGVIVCC